MKEIPQKRGMYFEEFEIGQHTVTPGRTITESDIVSFAGLSGDYNQIHVDQAFAEKTYFGQRVAHGLLVTAIASGLVTQIGILEGTIIAFREITSWKFSKPVFIGDTIVVEVDVLETRLMRRLGGGLVKIKLSVDNQHGEKVMSGEWSVLMASRPEE